MPTTKADRRSGFVLVAVTLTCVTGLVAYCFVASLPPRPLRQSPEPTSRELRTAIAVLERSIESFRAELGHEPPGGLVFSERGGQWEEADRARMRSVFGPKFDFRVDNDLNHDGRLQSLHLSGAECLVLFLGGPPSENGVPAGLSGNPARPFELGRGARRSFHEFALADLVDVDADGMPEYQPAVCRAPILYVQPWDVAPESLKFYPAGDERNLEDCYREPDGEPYGRGFQLLSAGPDGSFGRGGTTHLTDRRGTEFDEEMSDREPEWDNSSNLWQGRLAGPPW